MEKESSVKINLNTFKLEKGTNPFGGIEGFQKISGIEFDEQLDKIFSLDSKQLAFGNNFKEKNIIGIEQLDGSTKNIEIPSILCGGMGVSVSTISLIKAMNKLGFGGHLSSIGISMIEEPFLYDENGKEQFHKVENEIKNSFYELFENKLGLSKEQINKHFFKSMEIDNTEIDNPFENKGKKAKLLRMKDLIVTYKHIQELKSNGNNVGINCMYKTTSYISILKIASLAGVDFITVGAGIPLKRPNIIIKEFLEDIGKKDSQIPAFGLIISSVRSFQKGYDYYIIEDANEAGGHEGLSAKSMGKKASKKYFILEKTLKKIADNTPIYITGGIANKEDIKEAFDKGASGVQIGTNLAVSQEAVEGQGEDFKNILISGNHLGQNKDIDKLYIKEFQESETNFKLASKKCEREILHILNIELDSMESSFFRLTLIQDLYFGNNIFDNLNADYQAIYNNIMKTIQQELSINPKFEKLIQKYGNTLQAIKEFQRYKKKEEIATHLLFDSTVGFNGRKRISKNDNDMLNENIKTRSCVECLTNCISSHRGKNRIAKANAFCIFDWLDKISGTPNRQLNFSGRTTVFYPEIREVKDIMGAYLGYYVER